VGWCEEVVVGVAKAMQEIVQKSVRGKGKRTALAGIIAILETRALRCCETGDFWKACVLPIVKKWQLWKDKWNNFGIPPDPTWD
jgi:hypothetical protein